MNDPRYAMTGFNTTEYDLQDDSDVWDMMAEMGAPRGGFWGQIPMVQFDVQF